MASSQQTKSFVSWGYVNLHVFITLQLHPHEPEPPEVSCYVQNANMTVLIAAFNGAI